MKTREFTDIRPVVVTLTPEERIARFMEAIQFREAAETREAKLREHTKCEKEKVTGDEQAAARLDDIGRSGKETCDIKCTTTFDYENKRVTVTRCDTGEIIDYYEMSEHEAQMEIDVIADALQQEDGVPRFAYCGADGLPIMVTDAGNTGQEFVSVKRRSGGRGFERVKGIKAENTFDAAQAALNAYASANGMKTCCRVCGDSNPTGDWPMSDKCGKCYSKEVAACARQNH